MLTAGAPMKSTESQKGDMIQPDAAGWARATGDPGDTGAGVAVAAFPRAEDAWFLLRFLIPRLAIADVPARPLTCMSRHMARHAG